MGLFIVVLALAGMSILIGVILALMDDNPETILGGFAVGLFAAALVAIPIVLTMSTATIGGVNSMIAYHDNNASAYRTASEALRVGVPRHGEALFFESANLKQIEDYRVFLKDERNAVIRFNKKLQSYRYWEKGWWFGWYWANTPPHILPIVLEVATES